MSMLGRSWPVKSEEMLALIVLQGARGYGFEGPESRLWSRSGCFGWIAAFVLVIVQLGAPVSSSAPGDSLVSL